MNNYFKSFPRSNGQVTMVNMLNVNHMQLYKEEDEPTLDPDRDHPILSRMPRPIEELTFWYFTVNFDNGDFFSSKKFYKQEHAESRMTDLLI